MYTQSEELFKKSSEYIPGGVNSPVRAFKQVGGSPVFMHAAKGAYLFDVDGNKYIDYICSWGPMILGHQHPDVVRGLKKQLELGISYGAPTVAEYEIAKLICENVPNVDLIRFCSSGTEACMSAIRVARGYTKRAKILKFNGHYHGHADSFLKKAGSGVATLGIQVVGGVTEGVLRDTLVAEYNNIKSVREIVENHQKTRQISVNRKHNRRFVGDTAPMQCGRVSLCVSHLMPKCYVKLILGKRPAEWQCDIQGF